MRSAKKTLAFILVTSMVFMMLPLSAQAADPVCQIGATPYSSLGLALDAVNSMEEGAEATITLLCDIDYDTGISITGRTVTFDLNGNMLDVIADEMYGLEVGSGGVVNMVDESGTGTFNIANTAPEGYGVYVHDGGRATVTEVTAESLTEDCGVCAEGEGSYIEVVGDVSGEDGVVAYDGGVVKVGGSADGYYLGARASGSGSRVEVTGNVYGANGNGAGAYGGGIITVGGNVEAMYDGVRADGKDSSIEVMGHVTCRDSDGDATAVKATNGGFVEVGGNVSATAYVDDEDGYTAYGVYVTLSSEAHIGGNVSAYGWSGAGVACGNASQAVIDGQITHSPDLSYIVMGYALNEHFNKGDGETGTDLYEAYLLYIDSGGSIVFTKTDKVCKIGGTLYSSLDDALATVDEGEEAAIKLLCDIDYKGDISIVDRSVTFDLNDHTLNITNDAGTALEVSDGGEVFIDPGYEEEGELNVISMGGCAVDVYDGVAFVTNATASYAGDEGGIAVVAAGEGSRVTVYGDARSTNPYYEFPAAVVAVNGASILVEGNVFCTGNLVRIGEMYGVVATLDGSVEVKGGVSVSYIEDPGSGEGEVYGVRASNGGVAIIGEDVEADGPGLVAGAAAFCGTLIVGGNLTAQGEGEVIGAWSAWGDSAAIINGTITVPEGKKEIALDNTLVTGVVGELGGLPFDLIELLEDFNREDLACDLYMSYCYTEGSEVNYIYVRELSDAVCVLDGVGYDNLGDALATVGEGETATIKLLQDIDYEGGLVIAGRTVTFDLNDYTLNITNEAGTALTVSDGGKVYSDPGPKEAGELNAISKETGFAVYVCNGSEAVLTNATAGSEGEETGGAAVVALDGGWAVLRGDAICINPYGFFPAAVAAAEDSGVLVYGDVLCSGSLTEMAAVVGAAAMGGTVIVSGDIMAEGDGESAGAVAMDHGIIIVGGDVEAAGEGEVYGAWSSGGDVVINGVVTVPEGGTAIALGDDRVTGIEGEIDELSDDLYELLEDLDLDDLAFDDYLVYSYEEIVEDEEIYSCVYVKASGPVCKIGEIEYDTLDEALDAAEDGEETTIKLLRDIGYYAGMEIVGKTIIFDLNKCELYVYNDEGHGLTVGAGGVVDIIDDYDEGYSSFYAASGYDYGVYAHDGGRATLTIACGQQGAVLAEGGAAVRVKDWADGNEVGVSVTGGSTVTIDGELSSEYMKPYMMLEGVGKAKGDGMIGTGDYKGHLVYSDDNGNVVRVKTDAVCKLSLTIPYDSTTFSTYVTFHSTLDEAISTVKSTLHGATAVITLFTDINHDKGIEFTDYDVTFDLNGHTLDVISDDGYGLKVGAGGVVDIIGEGKFNVTSNAESGCGVYAHNGGRATVTDAAATGLNGIGVSATGGSTVTVDGGISASEYIRLGGVTKLESAGVPGTGDYENYLIYSDDSGNIVRVNNTVISAAISPTEVFFNLDAPEDICTTITWNDAKTVNGVVYGSDSLKAPEDFNIDVNTLTIAEEYLTGLGLMDGDKVELVISFDKGESAILTVTAAAAPSAGTAPTITTTELTGGTVDKEYSQTLAATGDAPITWSMADGSDPLPGGLTLSSGGFISGTPTTAGTFNFTVKAANAAGSNTQALSIIISSVPTYSLTIKAGTGGSITTGSSGSYAAGSIITIAASANANYSFNKWTVTGGGNFGKANSASTTFTMPAGAATITAEFTYNGGGGGGAGGGTSPAYYAVIEGGGKVPVSVSTGADSAAVNLDGATAESLASGGITAITLPSIPGVNSFTANLPTSSLSGSNGEGTLTLDTSLGSVTIPGNMLSGTGLTGVAGITIGTDDKENLPDEVKAALGDRPILQITLTVNGRQTNWSNDSAPVTVSIPYAPTAEELANPEHIVVWYIDGSGNAVSVPNGRYNPETGTVTFSTTHFSLYAVAYVHKTFGDLGAAEWARKPIEVMASKGIINGTSATVYSPSANITRADYLMLLIKTLGLTADFEANFDDVQPGAYYYEAVGIAKKLGITGGAGNNSFNPQGLISRQDMMVMTARALEKFKELKTATDLTVLDQFSDRGDIAGYAMESLSTLVKEGLITGSGGRLNPREQTTRAEAAVFLYRIYNSF